MKNLTIILSLIFLANSAFAMEMDWESTNKNTEEVKINHFEKLPENAISEIISKTLEKADYDIFKKELSNYKQVCKKFKSAASSHLIKEAFKKSINLKLQEAVDYGYINKLKQLILEGADNINATDKHAGLTLLMDVIFKHRDLYIRDWDDDDLSEEEEKLLKEMPSFLIEHGADVNFKRKVDNLSVLILAAQGHVSIVKLLVDKVKNINEQLDNGSTALIVAVRYNTIKKKAVTRLLLEKGADPNIKDKTGHTALYYAKQLRNWMDEGSGKWFSASDLINLLQKYNAKE